jgi:hypothetical protein
LAVYGKEWAGVDRETGKNVWYMNNDNTTSQPTTVNGRPATFRHQDASEKILGDIHPKLFGGFNTNFTWKGINIGMNFTYRIGGYTYNAAGRDINEDGYYWERIMSKDTYDNRWTPENKDAKYPMRIAIDLTDALQRGSRWMEKADYVRLKSLNIGYTIPKDIVNKLNISNARVFFNGQNLWTLAANKLYDPEVNEYGSRGWETPIGKTYTFGIELTF